MSWAELVKETRRRGWFTDEEILEFALNDARCQPDVRLFKKAEDLKKSKLEDWRELFEAPVTDREQEVRKILADNTLNTADQLRVYQEQGHGSRATFYRERKRLLGAAGSVSDEAGAAASRRRRLS